METKRESVLKLVWGFASHKKQEKKESPKVQMDLFGSNTENTLVIIYFYDLNGKRFSEILNETHPSYILDMRVNPRFDIDGYSRKIAFSEFDSIGSIYFDYTELVGPSDKNKSHIIQAAEKIVKTAKKGPVAFIFGKKDQDEEYEEELLDSLTDDKKNWSLSVLP